MAKTTQENVFQRHEKDTGSPEMQIGILSDEIAMLQSFEESSKEKKLLEIS